MFAFVKFYSLLISVVYDDCSETLNYFGFSLFVSYEIYSTDLKKPWFCIFLYFYQ